MASMELRDILELAREFRARRIRVGDIEVEMTSEGAVPGDFGVEKPRVPTEAEIRGEMDVRSMPEDYKKIFRGNLPSFEKLQRGAK